MLPAHKPSSGSPPARTNAPTSQARSFAGNPFDGYTLAAQLEQTTIMLQDQGVKPHTTVVDLGYRGVDADNPGVTIIHRVPRVSVLDALRAHDQERAAGVAPRTRVFQYLRPS